MYRVHRPQMYGSASNVQRIGTQMYCASNVQRIGLKCTQNRPQHVQINKFLTFDLSIYLSDVSIYLSALLKSISVHLRPILCTFEANFVRTFEANRTLPHLSWARASNPQASLVDFIADCTPLPGRGAVESDLPQMYVHLRPILCTFAG